MTLALAPNALALVPVTVPALIASPPVKVLVPPSESAEVALVCTTEVTFEPIAAAIVVVPVPVPLFVIAPVGFTAPDDKVVVAVPVLLRLRLPVPVVPPDSVRSFAAAIVRFRCSVT